MADFMTLKAKLSLDSSEYDSGLDKAEKKGSGFGKKRAGGAKAVAKGFAVMGTVAVGAVSVLTKKAVDSYAEYEQLAGGVKKLYGDAADEMMRYAEQGYKTAFFRSADQFPRWRCFGGGEADGCRHASDL